MSNADRKLIAELKAALTSQRYSPVVIGNYCAYARAFLDYLARWSISVAAVSEAQVARYLRHAVTMFRKRHGRPPGARWHAIPRSGIHALLRLARGQCDGGRAGGGVIVARALRESRLSLSSVHRGCRL